VIRALIFDFDGLILETEGPIFRAWQEIFASHGVDLTLETWGAVIGTSDHTPPAVMLEQRLGKSLDHASLNAQQKARESELIAMQAVRPGVEQYLKDARRLGLKIGLASSSSCRWVVGHLERLGLHAYFDVICARDDVRQTKPDPELYVRALQALEVSGEEAIAIEDSPNGVLAAKRAGLYCVAVPNELTQRLPLDHADLRIQSLEAMPLEALLAHFERLHSP